MRENLEEENEGEVSGIRRKEEKEETFWKLAGGIGERGGEKSREEGRGKEEWRRVQSLAPLS